MTEIDRLVHCLEALVEFLYIKRRLLQLECQHLRTLLAPWVFTDSKLSKKLPPVIQREADSTSEPPHVQALCDPIDVELLKVNKLLEKVEKVRHSVKDEEVCKVCNIERPVVEPSGMKSKVKPFVSSNKSASNTKPHETKQDEEKANRLARIRRLTNGANKTCYQSAYQVPRTSSASSKVSKYGSKQSSSKITTSLVVSSEGTLPVSAGDSTRITDITNKSQTYVERSAAAKSSGDQKSTGQELGVEEITKFTLQNHGRMLIVPRSLKLHSKKNRQLREKISNHSVGHPSMSDKMRRYFQSVEVLDSVSASARKSQ